MSVIGFMQGRRIFEGVVAYPMSRPDHDGVRLLSAFMVLAGLWATLMLEDSLRLSEGHAIGEEIEQAIRNTLPNLDVVVHVEPYAEEMSHQAIQHGISNPNEKAPRLSEGLRHGQPGQTDTVSD